MKALLKLLILLLIPINITAQNSIQSDLSAKEIVSVNQAVQLYWDWKTDEDPIKAISLLKEIATENHHNWIAPYWAAYIATQIANSTDKNKIEYLNKAQSFYDQAVGRFSFMNEKEEDQHTSSYFNALHSLILRLKGFYYKSINDDVKADEFSLKSIEELNLGIKKSTNNPILMVLAATETATAKGRNFGHVIAAIALLEKAKKEFKKIKNRNVSDITYWNEHWIDSWLNNLRPPNN